MPKRELKTLSAKLTDEALSLCRAGEGHEAVKDQLRFAAAGVETHVREAIEHQTGRVAIAELKAAEKDCRETSYWLSLLTRNGILPKAEGEGVGLLCQKLQRRLGGAIREREARLAERTERPPSEVTIPTTRLLLRSFSGRYAVSLPTLVAEEERRLVGLTCRDREEALRQIRLWQERDEMLAVLRQRDGRFVGFVGLMAEAHPHIRRLTVAIAGDARLRGYGTEAVRGALSYGFSKLGMTVAVATLHREEAVMRKILTHCGFREEGILRGAAEDGGDLLRLSCLKEEWQS